MKIVLKIDYILLCFIISREVKKYDLFSTLLIKGGYSCFQFDVNYRHTYKGKWLLQLSSTPLLNVFFHFIVSLLRWAFGAFDTLIIAACKYWVAIWTTYFRSSDSLTNCNNYPNGVIAGAVYVNIDRRHIRWLHHFIFNSMACCFILVVLVYLISLC